MKNGILKISLLIVFFIESHLAFADGEHWVCNYYEFPYNSTFISVITIDGVEQRSEQLELGAFNNGTCRGSVLCQYEARKDRYFAYLTVSASNGMELTFRLYDHATEEELDVTCDVAYTFMPDENFGLPSDPYIFPFTTNSSEVVFNGSVNNLWSEQGNWNGGVLPGNSDIVVINSSCVLDIDAEVQQLAVSDGQSLTIQNGGTLAVGSICSDDATKLVIAEGGQLICNALSGVLATVQKSIAGYGEDDNGNWRFIASPLVQGTDHTSIGNLVNENGYDLYSFDQTASDGLEWLNFKSNNLLFNPGEGYLYANVSDVILEFAGELNSTVSDADLAYCTSCALPGWNLVGNPFTHNVYADRSYFVLNEEGTAIEPVPVSQGVAIAPCSGIMVKASEEGEKIRFGSAVTTKNDGHLQLVVRSETRDKKTDKAIVSFNGMDDLPKFVFDDGNPLLYLTHEGLDYAIASSLDSEGEIPVGFNANKNADYILNVEIKDVDMEYLHLIDNLTGDDINLLETPNYHFKGNVSDYACRFKLVYKKGDCEKPNGTESFVFQHNDELKIHNSRAAILQVFDITGRVINEEFINGDATITTNGLETGIYLIRLINGTEEKVQKIIVEK